MKNRKANIISTLLTVVFLGTPRSFGQDNPQSQSPNPQSEARIGVNPSKRVTMTLRDAMSMALENNRDIEVERLNAQMSGFDLQAAQGFYDPALAATFYHDHRAIPATSIFASGKNDNLIGSASLTQRTPWQGSSITGAIDNNRATTDNLFVTLNPQYTTNLSFTFTQPILRNRTIDSGRRQIKIMKKRLDISDSQFRQRAIEIIAQVQRAYWDLVFARRDQEIKRESVELANTQLEHNERLVEAGTLAKSDIISARVELERRKDEAEAAVDAIQRAENALKALMAQAGDGEIWQSELVPVEQPQIEPSASLPLDDALRLARQNRPEMEQYRLRGDLNKIDAEYLRNQTKPQIDFFVTYGAFGLAGAERDTVNPITRGNEELYKRVNELSVKAGLPELQAV